VKLFPVNSTSTREVTASLSKYFKFYSRPRRIISNRGSCFTSSEFNEFLAERNIGHIKLATCAPQANGQVEIVTTTMLGKFNNPIIQADWYKLINKVEHAINNSFKNIDLKDIRDIANLKTVEPQKRNEVIKAAKQKAPSEYSVGDFLAIRNIDVTPGTCTKLAPKYRGLYKINRVFDNDRYEVTDIDNCQLTQLPYKGILEAARLKPLLNIKENCSIMYIILIEVDQYYVRLTEL